MVFLASVLEQLDLAHEHVVKRDPHNARFSLMLTDNALELVFHQAAKDKSLLTRNFSRSRDDYPNKAALDRALGRSFADKLNFVVLEGGLSRNIANTIGIMHKLRNEVYHAGLMHEAILPQIAAFYFSEACQYIAQYEPLFFGWSSNDRLPERAKKYFPDETFALGGRKIFHQACTGLALKSGHEPEAVVEALADRLDEIIEEQDSCLDLIADGVYASQKTTRNIAVVRTQAWVIAFAEDGRKYAIENGWSGNRLELVRWLEENYPFQYRKDPIPGWQKQAAKVRREADPHLALARYDRFLTETDKVREWIGETASQVDAEISNAIDRMRGK